MYPISIKFVYDGHTRHVDNVTLEGKTFIGFEVRKGGKFSYKIKRYSGEKMTQIERIDPIKRHGPVIGRPETRGA